MTEAQGMDIWSQLSLLPCADVFAQGEKATHAPQLWETTSPAWKQPFSPIPQKGRSGQDPRGNKGRGSQNENWWGPWEDGLTLASVD